MLVLSRDVQEEVRLKIPPSSDEQEVIVKYIRGAGKIRIGFDAPPEINIFRPETRDGDDHETGRAA